MTDLQDKLVNHISQALEGEVESMGEGFGDYKLVRVILAVIKASIPFIVQTVQREKRIVNGADCFKIN